MLLKLIFARRNILKICCGSEVVLILWCVVIALIFSRFLRFGFCHQETTDISSNIFIALKCY